MNPDIQPLDPVPIDPPDNTGGGGRRALVNDEADPDASASEAQRLAIDPPDNTGGG